MYFSTFSLVGRTFVGGERISRHGRDEPTSYSIDVRVYLGYNFIALLDPLFECIEYERERFHSGVITSVIDRIRILL